MSYRLGVVVLVALCAVSANAQVSQVLGYISQSFNLVRSDTLEVANYVSLANITKKDDSDVNAKAQEYEERLYPAAKWVCTARSLPKTSSSPTRAMFLDVFRYFSGANVDRKEIDLTVPVSTLVMPKENDQVHYETCLVLPKAYQKEAPKPDNAAVYFDDKTERVVLTRRVSGYFITDSAWETEASNLKKFLKEKVGEVDADFSGYYRNGYDAPMRIFNRRNEVWYVKKGLSAEKAIEDYKKKLTEATAAATVTVEEVKVEEAESVSVKPETDTKKVEAVEAETEKVVEATTTTAKPAVVEKSSTTVAPKKTAEVTTKKSAEAATTKKPDEKKSPAETRQ